MGSSGSPGSHSHFLKLDTLEPQFRQKLDALLSHLRINYGVVMVPYETRRTPHQQAIIWRQSRPKNMINKAVSMLRANGAPFLSKILDSVGPQSGPHSTNALPGKSWHQWDNAADCYWEVNGKPSWSTSHTIKGINGYKLYAREAGRFGLTSLGAKYGWDWVHVQDSKLDAPQVSWRTIDIAMKEKYS